MISLMSGLLAVAAHAQEPDSVVLYGRIYGLAESVSIDGGGQPSRQFTRVSNNSSMVGVRGVEALGPSLSAWFQLETGFPIDQSGPPFANRNSAVGLRGPWGTFLAGRWDTPFEQTQVGIVDPFQDQGLPDITGAAVNQGNYARRVQNTLQYWSPPWRGFQLKLGYAANEGRTATANPYDCAASVAWRDADTFLAVAYETHRDQARATVVPGVNESGWGISGSRWWGPLKISGQAGEYRRTATGTQRSGMLGLEWQVSGAGSGGPAILAIAQSSRGGGPLDAAQPSCRLWGAALRHSFSPRTFVIAEYARVDNRVGNLCNFGANAIEIVDGQRLTGWAVGMRTLF
jgi:predicted porin